MSQRQSQPKGAVIAQVFASISIKIMVIVKYFNPLSKQKT